MCVKSTLTILFDAPFWVGILERIDHNQMEVSRIVFGAEPKDYEVYQYILQHWTDIKFSPQIKLETVAARKFNPKRAQRQIKGELSQNGIGTKAQQALKLQQEERKNTHCQKSKLQREAEKQQKFELRQTKKKEKHKGR